jgi:hypothetical protein
MGEDQITVVLRAALAVLLLLAAEASAQPALDEARHAVETRLGVSLAGEPPDVVWAASDDEFVRRHVELTGSKPYDWVLAVAVPAKNTLLVRGNRIGTGANFVSPTLRHELGHLALARVVRRNGRPLPRWLEEGLCEYAAGVGLTRETELELGAAARFGSLETLGELAGSFPPHAEQAQRAYLVARGFVAFLDERSQPEGVRGIVFLIERRESWEDAITHATGMSPGEAEAEWRRELASKHSIGEALLRSPEAWGSLLGLAGFVAAIVLFVTRKRRRRKSPRK